MAEEWLTYKIAELEHDLKQSRAHEKALEELLEKKLSEIYVHYHISRTIGSLLDLQEMLFQVMVIIKKSLPYERVSVYLLDENRTQLELVFYSGIDLTHKMILSVGEGTPGRVVERGEHIHIHDLGVFYETFNDFIHHPGEEKCDGSYIGIALKAHNMTIGVIGIDSSTKCGLSVDDMDFMAILSHQLAAGMEKSLLFEKTRQLSQRDSLTGLYNHRVFKEKLLQEINRRRRNQKPLSIIMLDIDHFKKFNDTYGHQTGDAVLKELAMIIAGQTRSTAADVCSRYGGEEFAIILPEQDLSQAMTIAERLRKNVEEFPFSLGDANITGRVTISLGVACVTDENGDGLNGVIKRADDALYRSKRNGRNRVSSFHK